MQRVHGKQTINESIRREYMYLPQANYEKGINTARGTIGEVGNPEQSAELRSLVNPRS